MDPGMDPFQYEQVVKNAYQDNTLANESSVPKVTSIL